MKRTRSSTGLQIIFSIFLGLLVAAFAGVGVNTLYPSPEVASADRIKSLTREEMEIRARTMPDALTAEDRTRIHAITDERDKIEEANRNPVESWRRRTSIILIVFATLVMAISLARGSELPAISDGLLLGGIFTMLYGVGCIVISETSAARFGVISFALLVTIALGYVRFVRFPSHSAATAREEPAGGEEIAVLEKRVRDLERRMNDAAHALGRKSADFETPA